MVRRPWIVLIGVVAYTGLLLVVREQVVYVPSVTIFGSAGMKLMNFLPLLVCLALLLSLDRRLGHAELTGVRPVVRADRGLVLAATGVVLLTGALFHLRLDMPTATAAGRNTLFLVGFALLVRARFGGTVAASATAGWLFVTVAAGLRTPQDPYPWGLLLEPWNEPVAAAATAVVALLGLVALRREPPRG
ncbi:hypothetical protein [Streptomyces zingiberis]|uniref:Uncharacterized protein n=1 Tax=Streptomyces zingiberis TaxID=2053010 RepID=A0ABX1BRR3_9ACTN|nr:hypothetical protein [Streptomyces zingiberis]NJP99157.1 hypothetical protein [Streptomyces zingiberis]